MWRPAFVSRLFRSFRVSLWNRIPSFRTHSGFVNRISVVTLLFPPTLYAFTWPFSRQNEVPNVPEEVDPISVEKRLFGQSLLYIELGEYTQANKLLHKLLYHLHTEHQSRHIDDYGYASRRARVCSELANLNLLEGRLEPAELLLKQTIQDCITSGLPVTSSEVIELSLKLALIYDQLGRDEEAETGYRFCISMQENKMDSQNHVPTASDEEIVRNKEQDFANEAALLGMSCNYYAKFLFSRGDSQSALQFAERSLQLASQLYPTSHPNCIHLLSSIGVIHADCDDGDDANGTKTGAHVDRARVYLKRAYDLARSSLDACTDGDGGRGEGFEVGIDGRTMLAGSLANILIEWAVVEAKVGRKAKAEQLIVEAESVLRVAAAASSQANIYRLRLAEVKREYSL